MPTSALATNQLLSDLEVVDFIVNGYLILNVPHREGLCETIAGRLDAMTTNPGDAVTDDEWVPELLEVVEHPQVVAAVTSLLGHDYELMEHRHWHCKESGTPFMHWHQDSTNTRTPGVDKLLLLFYPSDVTAEMGPTIVVPGTQFRNAPTDRMRTYSNIRGQVPLVVPAGTVAVCHYDVWHGTAANRSAVRRHMVKFLLRRTRSNTSPSWGHADQGASGRLDWNARAQSRTPADVLTFANPLGVSQTEQYKERAIRQRVWRELLGDG